MAKAKKPAKKKTPLKKGAAKKSSVKKPAAQKAIAQPAAKKAPKKVFSKKPAAKKTAVKKAAAKKAPVKPVRKSAAPKVFAKKKGPQGLPEQLLDAALRVLEDRQAEDVVPVNLEGRSAMADYIVVASGRASRQLSAIAHYLREAFAKLGVTNLRVEGLSEGNWVLVDAGDVIVHLFRPEVRRYYNLEQIWDRSRGPGAPARDDFEENAERE